MTRETWSDPEIEKLKQLYITGFDAAAMLNILPDRSEDAINRKLQRLLQSQWDNINRCWKNPLPAISPPILSSIEKARNSKKGLSALQQIDNLPTGMATRSTPDGLCKEPTRFKTTSILQSDAKQSVITHLNDEWRKPGRRFHHQECFLYELIWFISPNACRALSLFLNGPDPDTVRKWTRTSIKELIPDPNKLTEIEFIPALLSIWREKFHVPSGEDIRCGIVVDAASVDKSFALTDLTIDGVVDVSVLEPDEIAEAKSNYQAFQQLFNRLKATHSLITCFYVFYMTPIGATIGRPIPILAMQSSQGTGDKDAVDNLQKICVLLAKHHFLVKYQTFDSDSMYFDFHKKFLNSYVQFDPLDVKSLIELGKQTLVFPDASHICKNARYWLNSHECIVVGSTDTNKCVNMETLKAVVPGNPEGDLWSNQQFTKMDDWFPKTLFSPDNFYRILNCADGLNNSAFFLVPTVLQIVMDASDFTRIEKAKLLYFGLAFLHPYLIFLYCGKRVSKSTISIPEFDKIKYETKKQPNCPRDKGPGAVGLFELGTAIEVYNLLVSILHFFLTEDYLDMLYLGSMVLESYFGRVRLRSHHDDSSRQFLRVMARLLAFDFAKTSIPLKPNKRNFSQVHITEPVGDCCRQLEEARSSLQELALNYWTLIDPLILVNPPTKIISESNVVLRLTRLFEPHARDFEEIDDPPPKTLQISIKPRKGSIQPLVRMISASQIHRVDGFVGLKNTSKSCFANSLLQLLFRAPLFFETLNVPQSFDISKIALRKIDRIPKLQLQTRRLLVSILQEMAKPRSQFSSIGSGKRLQAHFGLVNKTFDVHQFFLMLLDEMPPPVQDLFKICFEERYHEISPPNQEAYSFGSMFSLNLSVPVNTPDFQTILDNYVEMEILDYNFPSSKSTAIKTITFTKNPRILVIVLEIYRYDKKALKLDTTNMVIPNQIKLSKETYSLIGVVSHSGDFVNGHYISFVKIGSQFVECDDTAITEGHTLPIRTYFSPYLIFFSKDPDPSSAIQSQKIAPLLQEEISNEVHKTHSQRDLSNIIEQQAKVVSDLKHENSTLKRSNRDIKQEIDKIKLKLNQSVCQLNMSTQRNEELRKQYNIALYDLDRYKKFVQELHIDSIGTANEYRQSDLEKSRRFKQEYIAQLEAEIKSMIDLNQTLEKRIVRLQEDYEIQKEYNGFSEDEEESEPEAPLPEIDSATFGTGFDLSAVERRKTFLVQDEENSTKKFVVDKKACTKKKMKKVFSSSRRMFPTRREAKFIISASLSLNLICVIFIFIYIYTDFFVL